MKRNHSKYHDQRAVGTVARRDPLGAPGGFALVITVSLLILLAVVAVGLLTLSSITLRSSQQSGDMATARANARLALVMAIGELQKSLGPDQAVTAGSGIRKDSVSKRHLTGVWESWDYDPSDSPDYAEAKESRFQRWLVSSPDQDDLADLDFVTKAWSGDAVELVGDGALGDHAVAEDKIRAGLVPVASGAHTSGTYGWHVADESVKARVNIFRDPGDPKPLWRKRATLAGHRPKASVIRGRDGRTLDFLPTDDTKEEFQIAGDTEGKLVDLEQFALLDGAASVRPFRNDITPYSLGVLANAREGGLKQDLSRLLAMGDALPGEFSGTGGTLYQSTHGITGVSDPHWSALADYYNLFRDIEDPDTEPSLPVQLTKGTKVDDLSPSPEFAPAPVIAKVEMLLTYVTRDSTWSSPFMGFFVFTPLVTLHNPYNVNISFERLKVTLGAVPVGIRLRLNGSLKSTRFNPINKMYIIDSGTRDVETKYIMEIANWTRPNASMPRGEIQMKPGQSMICSPYLAPSTTWGDKGLIDNRGNRIGKGAAKGETLKAKPGFYGRCFGFNVDVVSPTDGAGTTANDVCLLKHGDRIAIEHKFLKQNTDTDGKFQVHTEFFSDGRWIPYGGLRFTFGSDRTLQRLTGRAYYTYPFDGSDMPVMNYYVPNTEPISDHGRAITFGVFSAYARTANGGVYETGKREKTVGSLNALRDGLLAGKPFLHHNPAVPVVSLDLKAQIRGNSSHEINLQQFVSHGDAEDYFAIDDENRAPIATGNSVVRGIKSATLFELPTGPLQTIADFRRSNALTSSYLPGFVQPVANSGVSPMMSTGKVVETNSGAAEYQLLDHSVLANHALYDRFYFSTLDDYDADGAESVFKGFLDGDTKLASQAFEPYLPTGQTLDSAKNELFGGSRDEAYRRSAEFQMIRGPFNVNSTSVEAWKAVLSSLSGSEIFTLWSKSNSLELRKSEDVPILAMTLPNGGAVDAPTDPNDTDNSRTNEWNGYRELSEDEVEDLAEAIVEEVRTRGPFLSLSEFVNRRVGPNSELTRAGALQNAIARAGINDMSFREAVPVEAEDIDNPKVYGFSTPEVATGNPTEGAPGWISQGDLMKILGPAATVRSDTFVIRVVGEARNSSDEVTARAYAEAVVQRTPEYVDRADRPSLNLSTDSKGKKANRVFGRRMELVSFRWLSPSEI